MAGPAGNERRDHHGGVAADEVALRQPGPRDTA